MKHLEYSSEKLNQECIKWGKQIFRNFKPDLIVYIARAGYICAKPISELADVPLLGIGAVRSGDILKEILGAIFVYCPKFIRNILATIELRSSIHKKNTERNVTFHKSLEYLNRAVYKSILVVDDAVDTGYSMKKAVEMVQEAFPEASVKSACLNMTCDEKDCVMKIDFVLIHGASVKTPFSKDHREYRKIKKLYYEETKNEYI